MESDSARLQKGEITLTDLAQSESSLAGANANLIKAKTELLASKTNFERVIREKVPSAINNNERIEVKLPNTLQEAINIAKLNNSDLLIAKLDAYGFDKKIMQAFPHYLCNLLNAAANMDRSGYLTCLGQPIDVLH